MKKILYGIYGSDKYELPLVVPSSCKEIAKTINKPRAFVQRHVKSRADFMYDGTLAHIEKIKLD